MGEVKPLAPHFASKSAIIGARRMLAASYRQKSASVALNLPIAPNTVPAFFALAVDRHVHRSGLAFSTEPLPEYDKDSKGETKQIFTPVEGNWYTVFRR
jgi:hypothetical protein